jgi:hypothetical protein
MAAILGAVAAGWGADARAADTFAWAPADAAAVRRGREVARDFGLLNLVELTVEVDNVFTDANRAALAEAERRLADVPGVRRVVGPAALLDLAVDADGKPSARRLLSRGGGEVEGEEARGLLARRADALGWFLGANGRFAHLFVDLGGQEVAAARPALAEALKESGLGLVLEAGPDAFSARALWPDPRARGARWLPAVLAGAWVLFLVLVGYKARPLTGGLSQGGAAGVVVAAMLGAVAPFVAVAVPSVRATGLAAAFAAAAAVVLGLALERGRGVNPRRWNHFARPPASLFLLALVSVAALAAFLPRLRVGTHQWSEAPLLFVDVRADLDQPVVLREVQRLTDVLRAQPGVAAAWSAADVFAAVETEGEPARRLPVEVEDGRRVLAQARSDPAVALELAADHHEGLVVVRFQDGSSGIDGRLALVERLATYVREDLRAHLVPVDLRDRSLGPIPRGVAKGLLASDTREHVARLCASWGRTLTRSELDAVDRVARQTASIPTVEPARLAAELAADARAFVAGYPVRLRAAEQERLVAALVALPFDDTEADVRRVVAAAYAARLTERVLADTASIWWRRLVAVRWRHTARLNIDAMLTGAELPTEGELADEVRGATLEGMGPVVGIPVAAATPGALTLAVAVTGGAANDAALSAAWLDGLRVALWLIVVWAVLLFVMGGLDGLLWLPIALAPGAEAALAAAVVREPLGLWGLAFLGGALAAGGVMAAAFAARRRR